MSYSAPRIARKRLANAGELSVTENGYTGDFSANTESRHCSMSAAAWKLAATGLRLVNSQRPMLALRTGESGCLSWPTPRSEDSECAGNHPGAVDSLTGATTLWRSPAAQDPGIKPERLTGEPGARMYDKETGRLAQYGITQQAEMWQTPATDSLRSRGGDRKDEMGLDQQARAMWGTPTSRDHKDGDVTGIDVPTNGLLGREVCHFSLPAPPTPQPGETSSPSGPGSRRRLNPAFVCWLMGWPWWWTQPVPISFARAEMESWRSRARSRLRSLLAGQGWTSGGGAMSNWATPQARDERNPDQPGSGNFQRKVERGFTIDLNSQAAMWTTPQAHDQGGGQAMRNRRGDSRGGCANLADEVCDWRLA